MRNSLIFCIVLLFALTGALLSAWMDPSALGLKNTVQPDLVGLPQPVFIRFQAQEDGNVQLWEAIPQNFSDYVAEINANALAVFVSSNAQGIATYRDGAGNLWVVTNYTLKKGDCMSTLSWVSSTTVRDNTSLPETIPFPPNYPSYVQPFLNPGKKIPSDNATFAHIAESYLDSTDMIQTVRNILNFVNSTQTYDREKVRLLMNGSLSTTDILDFMNDPSTSLAENRSFCFERALLAATLLRAVGVPARTFTNADMKTWIEVWLGPQTRWVDGEVLCLQASDASLFPRSMRFSVPWMIQNSSDASFTFTWLPKRLMRVANLTLQSPQAFEVKEYRTVLSQPVGINSFLASPPSYLFPILYEPRMIQGALTVNGSDITFHVSTGDKNASKLLTVGQSNSIDFEGWSISFKADLQGSMVFLSDFSVQAALVIDPRLLIPIVVAIPIVAIFFLCRRRKASKI